MEKSWCEKCGQPHHYFMGLRCEKQPNRIYPYCMDECVDWTPKMRTLILPIGYPGIGKSFWAKQMTEKYGIKSVSSDKIREELYGDASIQGDFAEVFHEVHKRVKRILQKDSICILDATNVTRKVRLKAIWATQPTEVIYVVMPDDIELAKRRNKERARVVPERVINRMAKSYHTDYPSYEEDGYWTKDCSIFSVDDEELYKCLSKKVGVV